MIHQIKTVENDIVKENQKERTNQNSAVKYRQDTLGYHQLRNQVKQEYYHKVQGCSVKSPQ